jgi:hypothetical protein
MHSRTRMRHASGSILAVAILLLTADRAAGQLHLGPEELVEAGGVDIDVPGYSVPSFVHWDSDGLKDLVVGQGSGTALVKVRVYLNEGTVLEPQFSTSFYAQSNGSDLTLTGFG